MQYDTNISHVESNASDSADSESDDAQTVDTILSDEPAFESDSEILNSDDCDDDSENLNENMDVNEEKNFVQEFSEESKKIADAAESLRKRELKNGNSYSAFEIRIRNFSG